MKYKRGADYRIEINKIKSEIINKLSLIEQDVKNAISECSTSDDEFNPFNRLMLEIALNELKQIKKPIEMIDKKKNANNQLTHLLETTFNIEEINLFNLVIENCTAQEIANQLSISKKAVEKRLERMLEKMSENGLIKDILEKHGYMTKDKDFEKPVATIRLLAKVILNIDE